MRGVRKLRPAEAATETRFTPPARTVSLSLDALRETLTPWLAARFDAPDLAITGITSPGAAGVNNETLLLDVTSSAPALRGLDGLVVRLQSPTTLFPGMDIRSSFTMYRLLEDEPSVPTPRVFGFEDDIGLLGRQFFVMERIDGKIPGDNPTYHHEGWVVDMPPAKRRELVLGAIETMAALHRLPVEKFAFMKELGVGTLAQQMAYWRGYLDADTKADPMLERCWAWLLANMPADAPEGFCWGDARIPNMIFQGTSCVGVLDWDMISLCGGEYDLAWWLLQEMSGGVGKPRLEGLPAPVETVQLWERAVGRKARNFEFWLMLNLFRLGAIMIRLKRFLIDAGTPPEHVAMIDTVNSAQSILHSRFGTGVDQRHGHWDFLAPTLSA